MALSSIRCISIFRTIKADTHVYLLAVNKFSTASIRQSNGFESGSNNSKETNRMEARGNKVLFVGLGNIDMPGTRHNVGMLFIDKMARSLELKLQKKKECMGLVGSVNVNGVEVIMLKPKLAMNINGTSVQKTVRHYGVDISNVYVLHDDLDRAVGKLSIKESGSAGGHNGVKSTINSLRTDAFPRLRIGIDRPTNTSMVGNYVLEKFTRPEQALIDKSVRKGVGQLCRHVENKIAVNIGHAFRNLPGVEDS